METELPPISEAERTPLEVALLGIIDALRQRIQTLEETVQKLRDENAILKGQKGKPKIAPSRLEKPPPKPPPSEGQKRPGSDKCSKKDAARTPTVVIVDHPDPPSGAVPNGYEEYDVQELVIKSEYTRYLRQRLKLPDGQT